jgi:antitoxin component of MazEF toxin-antitoxin module
MSVTVDADSGEVRATRKVRKSGNSTAVVIPPELLDAAGFERGDDVDLVADLTSGDVVLRPAKSPPDDA